MPTLRYLAALAIMVVAAPASAHQETVAYSRMSIRANGDVEYALKIPVEDLAESLGRDGHTALDAPDVRAAEALLFESFQPLIGVASDGVPCPVERRGIDVPEDERLYGELRFVFHCAEGATVTLDYRVFFDVDPGHMGMLEVETLGGTARAEIIRERPRWEVRTTAYALPELRAVDDAAAPAATTTTARIVREPFPGPTSADVRPVSSTVAPAPARAHRSSSDGKLIPLVVLVVIAAAAALYGMRVGRRRSS